MKLTRVEPELFLRRSLLFKAERIGWPVCTGTPGNCCGEEFGFAAPTLTVFVALPTGIIDGLGLKVTFLDDFFELGDTADGIKGVFSLALLVDAIVRELIYIICRPMDDMVMIPGGKRYPDVQALPDVVEVAQVLCKEVKFSMSFHHDVPQQFHPPRFSKRLQGLGMSWHLDKLEVDVINLSTSTTRSGYIKTNTI